MYTPGGPGDAHAAGIAAEVVRCHICADGAVGCGGCGGLEANG